MNTYLSLDPMELSQRQRHGYLLAAVAPRPIAFVSTIDSIGRVNLSPYSFFNVFSTNPPVMVFSPSKSGVSGKQKHSYLNVKEVPEAVINIVNYPIVEQMSLASTAYDRGINEFVKSGLTEIASDLVKPPRVAEAPAAFECKVQQVIELGEEGGAGNLVICRVLRMHFANRYVDESGKIDIPNLDLVGRMGGAYYNRSVKEALFEVTRPSSPHGIGIDQLPDHIKQSKILTGNNLARLGNLSELPGTESVKAIGNQKDVQRIKQEFSGEELSMEMHKLAKNYLEAGQAEFALKILMQVVE